ncbi:type VI secretion system-associated protein TagF [Porphyrobacter sp. YT40]|uniref:type VI secretion system-associated protein TagF n=1 Tax=Porphyrobacter sp. YT40 TaxID=2547601 RepID=UPI0015E8EABD|nr:type VI secretion system-associated protein TagF [Porphyrobacter sp. YT40]
MASASLECPALFGKLPGHGDFISRGVPGALRAPFDQWLSDWLAAAHEALGADFVEAYETAAPWLYHSPRAAAVLLPSVDAVGRQFPLLAVTVPEVPLQSTYDALVDAVSAGSDSDALRAALGALSPVEAAATPPVPQWFLPEGAPPCLPKPDSVPSWPLVEGCFV